MLLRNHKRKEWMQADLAVSELLAEIDRVYADPETVTQRFFDAGTVKRIHISKRADLLVMKIQEQTVCVKYFHDRRLRVRLRTFLGMAKGRKGYFSGVRLERMGVRVPEQLACLEFRPFGPTVVAMELLKDIRTTVCWFADHQPEKGTVTVPRALLERFAEFVASLHRQGVYHCDFSPRNVMVQQQGDELNFVLIDLEDVRFRSSVSRRYCLQNLARFARESVPHLSVYTLMRFLRIYIRQMGWNGSAADGVRQIMRLLR